MEEVFHGHTRVLEFRAGGRRALTTAEHPFWVKRKGWIKAGELCQGDLLRSHDARMCRVEGVRDTGEDVPVYNLRVGEYHTYFVGARDGLPSLWAHNWYRAFLNALKGFLFAKDEGSGGGQAEGAKATTHVGDGAKDSGAQGATDSAHSTKGALIQWPTQEAWDNAPIQDKRVASVTVTAKMADGKTAKGRPVELIKVIKVSPDDIPALKGDDVTENCHAATVGSASAPGGPFVLENMIPVLEDSCANIDNCVPKQLEKGAPIELQTAIDLQAGDILEWRVQFDGQERSAHTATVTTGKYVNGCVDTNETRVSQKPGTGSHQTVPLAAVLFEYHSFIIDDYQLEYVVKVWRRV